jgi:hypothetical protein
MVFAHKPMYTRSYKINKHKYSFNLTYVKTSYLCQNMYYEKNNDFVNCECLYVRQIIFFATFNFVIHIVNMHTQDSFSFGFVILECISFFV